MPGHRGPYDDERTSSVRTEHASTCSPSAPAADGSSAQRRLSADGSSAQVDDAGSARRVVLLQNPRTEQPSSAARSARPPLSPTGWARVDVADRFDSILSSRWEAGEAWASNRALSVPCGLDERVLRQWRDARKSLPLAALLVLPAPVTGELVAWVQDKRALTPHRRGVPMLNDALDRLEKRVGRDDRTEVLRALVDAQRRIGELLARLAAEGT